MNAVEQRLSGLVFDLLSDNRAFRTQLYWLMKHSDNDIFYATPNVQFEKRPDLHITIQHPEQQNYAVVIHISFRATASTPELMVNVSVKSNEQYLTNVQRVLLLSPVIHQALSELANVLGVARI